MFNMPKKRGRPILGPRIPYPRQLSEIESVHEAFLEPEFLAALRDAGCRPTPELARMKVERRQETPGGPVIFWFSHREPSEQIREEEAVDLLALKISQCVDQYIAEVREAMPPVQFRHEAEVFSKALTRFLQTVPDPRSALARAIDTEVKEAEIAVQPQSSEIDHERERLFDFPRIEEARSPSGARLRYYDDPCKHGIGDVLASLAKIQAAVESIQRMEAGRGNDFNRPAHALTERLALLFVQFTGKKVTFAYDSYHNKVAGPFGDFLETVGARIPKPFCLPGLANLISSYVDRTSGI